MVPAHSLLAVLLSTTALADPAPIPDPQLTIGFAPYAVTFHVSGPTAPFTGAILGSLEPSPCRRGDAGRTGAFHCQL